MLGMCVQNLALNPRKIEHILHRIGVRQWIGEKAKIRVQYINGIRDWKKWFL